MKRRWSAILAISAVVAAGVTLGARPSAARDAGAAVRAAGSWGRAIEVPGLEALSKGPGAAVSQVSCASPGNCAAGGDYIDRAGHDQGFVINQRDGRWGTAIEMPGLAALNKGGFAQVSSVSCGSAANCAAGGNYRDGHRSDHGFVAVERNGRWGTALEVPGLAALNRGGDTQVFSVSCGSAGSCAAGGDYTYHSSNSQGFVAVERNGRWAKAFAVPGLAALNRGGAAEVDSVSCGSAGSCAAAGDYTDRHGSQQGFVAVERNGRWGRAIAVPGLAALNKGAVAEVDSVSCGSPGNCTAAGDYTDRRGIDLGFVASYRHGRWGTAIAVPGLAALDTGPDPVTVAPEVSCASAGNCVAGGNYTDRGGADQGFVAVERNGRWDKAIQVPGLAVLSNGGFTSVNSVSCAPAGNCAVGGGYTDRLGHGQGFVALERDGRWGTAIAVPGLAALNTGGAAGVDSVSCPPAGHCIAGGTYTNRRGHYRGFVTRTS